VWPEKPLDGYDNVRVANATIHLWDTATGREMATLAYKQGAESKDDLTIDRNEFAFASNNRYFLFLRTEVSRRFRTLKVFDTKTGANVLSLPVCTFCISPDERLIAAVEEDVGRKQQILRIREIGSWRELQCVATASRLPWGPWAFYNLEFSANSESLAYTASRIQRRTRTRKHVRLQSEVVVWHIPTETLRARVRGVHGAHALSPGFETLAVAHRVSETGQVRLWDLKSGREACVLKLPGVKFPYGLDLLTFGNNGETLTAIAGNSNYFTTRLVYWSLDRVVTWNTRTQRVITSFEANQKHLTNREWYYYPVSYGVPPNFLPRFLLRAENYELDILDLANGAKQCAVGNPDYESCMMSPNGRYFVLRRCPRVDGSLFWEWLSDHWPSLAQLRPKSNHLQTWDMATGSELAAIRGTFAHCLISPDSQTMATQTSDGIIALWSLPPRKPLGLILAWSCVPAALALLFAWWRGRRLSRASATSTV
jgi:WD40 repeat protein